MDKHARNSLRNILPLWLTEPLRSAKYRLLNILEIYRYQLNTIEEPGINQSISNAVLTTSKLFTARKTIFFYPDLPNPASTLHKICLNLGYQMTHNPTHKFDLAIKWRDDTFYTPDETFEKIKIKYKIINGNCLNISKSNVSKTFEKVFGYPLHINPVTYNGLCLKKSEINAVRDEQIVQCPINQPEQGFVYQKLIDNQTADKSFKDIRVPVIHGEIPFVYYVYRNENQRFIRGTIHVELKYGDDEFSGDEKIKISQFCKDFALDFGELDILRDNHDHRIYIVDANNTPSGPPKKLSHTLKISAINKLSDVFRKHFIEAE